MAHWRAHALPRLSRKRRADRSLSRVGRDGLLEGQAAFCLPQLRRERDRMTEFVQSVGK